MDNVNSIDLATKESLRTHLLHRRRGLQAAITESLEADHLVALLQEVDAALERMNAGSYGICDICKEPVKESNLRIDPLVTTCLSHMSDDQRRALERDLDLASGIQNNLLPKNDLRLVGWEICYSYAPAGPVSGDYCDIIAASGGTEPLILVGDVSGKGVAASLLMSHLHAIFRSLAIVPLPVHDLVARANRVFCESAISGHFATLVCGRFGTTGALHFCNAGHCPPLLLRGGEVVALEATGIPVGMFRDSTYTVTETALRLGDTLLLYTDGLTESRNNANEEYGDERLAALLMKHSGLTPHKLLEACLDDCRAFSSGASRVDDVTLMVVQRTPTS